LRAAASGGWRSTNIEEGGTGGGARTKNLAEKIEALRQKRGRYGATNARQQGLQRWPLTPAANTRGPSADSRMFYDILKGMSGARRSGPVGIVQRWNRGL
jgi:hypothetical protein